jgi:long-chain acyl-CoA synthetase
MAAGRDTPDGDAVFERSWRAVAPDDLLTLVYTSGTTGTPKAVMLTHRNMLWMMESIRRDAPVAPGSRLLSYLPLAHLAERKITHYQSITTGAHLHFCSDIERFGAVLAAAKPHYLFGTPRIWEKLGGALSEMIAVSPELQAEYDIAAAAVEDEREGRAVADPERVAAARAALRPSLDKLGLADIAIAIAGGAPPAPDLVTFFRVLGVQICGFYGFTEMGGGGTWWRSTGYRLGTDGLPIPGVEIVRSDDGELVVRGGGVSPGYFKDPEATAAVFFGDGWVRSGDLGEIDDDGSIRIVGRKKELIITSGGKNISPTFVENMLIGHHLVGQACAIGDGRRYVIALLTLDAESATRFAVENGLGTTDLAELAEHPRVLEEVAAGVVEANSHLNRQEQVKRFVLSGSEWTITSGEMTPTMKMKRRSIAVNFADRIEGAYAGTAGVPVA